MSLTEIQSTTGARGQGTPELRFDQTVPGTLVHRRAVGEVLVTDFALHEPDRYLVASQPPRAHALWCDRALPVHDPLMATEAGRQATVLIAHTYYGVPHGFVFVAQEMNVRVTSVEPFRDRGELAQAVFDMRVTGKEERDGLLAAMSFEIGLAIDGAPAAELVGSMMFLPRSDYDGMRQHLRAKKGLTEGARPPLPDPVGPALVGRRSEHNVLLGEPREGDGGETRYTLIVREDHPSLFDHPLDHVPGTLLMEAYRQAAVASAASADLMAPDAAFVTRFSGRFSDFAELELPVECAATATRAGDGVSVALELHQGGRQISEGTIELAALA